MSTMTKKKSLRESRSPSDLTTVAGRIRHLRVRVRQESNRQFSAVCGVNIRTAFAWQKGTLHPSEDSIVLMCDGTKKTPAWVRYGRG